MFLKFVVTCGRPQDEGVPRIAIDIDDIATIQEQGRWIVDINDRNKQIYTVTPNSVLVYTKKGMSYVITADFDILLEKLDAHRSKIA